MVATVAKAPGRSGSPPPRFGEGVGPGPARPWAVSGAGRRPSRLRPFVLGTIWLVFVLGPIYYMVLISFRSPD